MRLRRKELDSGAQERREKRNWKGRAVLLFGE